MNLRYWFAAGTALVRHSYCTPGFADKLARAGLRADTDPKAGTVFWLDAYPEAADVEVNLGTVQFQRYNIDPLEQFVIGALCRLRQPRKVFEIGTFDGSNTLLLARNAPEAQIFTVDLPPELADRSTVEGEIANARSGVGRKFRGRPEAERITQLYGDTRTFDFTPWFSSVDLVVVDAGHEYECARADTLTALKLVHEAGVVIWDDYQEGWPGVIRAVDEGPMPVVHIANTGLAIYDRRALAAREHSITHAKG